MNGAGENRAGVASAWGRSICHRPRLCPQRTHRHGGVPRSRARRTGAGHSGCRLRGSRPLDGPPHALTTHAQTDGQSPAEAPNGRALHAGRADPEVQHGPPLQAPPQTVQALPPMTSHTGPFWGPFAYHSPETSDLQWGGFRIKRDLGGPWGRY